MAVRADADMDADGVPGDLPSRCHIDAWRPGVPGIAEVFHARLVDYAYPPHCHDTWTVVILDAGAISYALDRRRCGAAGQTVTILPPEVVHDGRPAPGMRGFRKRVLYLDNGFLPRELIGSAVDHTNIDDAALRSMIARLHDGLVRGEESLAAEGGLSLVAERIGAHLDPSWRMVPPPERSVAYQLREMLDAHLVEPVTLRQAAAALDRSVSHLVRSFTREFGVSPHAYVIGRRIDAGRRQLLEGARPIDVAAALGFFDQAHFTRHFKRHTSVTPTAYAASHTCRSDGPFAPG